MQYKQRGIAGRVQLHAALILEHIRLSMNKPVNVYSRLVKTRGVVTMS